MPKYPELQRMLDDMSAQSELFRPTPFWETASAAIVVELERDGVESFRRAAAALGYFVPTYGVPANGFSAEQSASLKERLVALSPDGKKVRLALDQFLDGRMQALGDYRVLLSADEPDRLPFLHRFSESSVGDPVGQWTFEGRTFSRSSLNYLLGMAFLKRHAPDFAFRTVLEVGGGFGTLGEVLASAGIDELRYIDIDIPPTSFVAENYLKGVLGPTSVECYASTHARAEIFVDDLPMASVLCSWQIEKLRGTVDLFVNFISFQEMEPAVVSNYLGHASRLGARYVLLRNLREGKQRRKPGGPVGVDDPILGDDYGKMLPDYELVARNVFPFGYETVDGFHSELQLLRRKS